MKLKLFQSKAGTCQCRRCFCSRFGTWSVELSLSSNFKLPRSCLGQVCCWVGRYFQSDLPANTLVRSSPHLELRSFLFKDGSNDPKVLGMDESMSGRMTSLPSARVSSSPLAQLEQLNAGKASFLRRSRSQFCTRRDPSFVRTTLNTASTTCRSQKMTTCALTFCVRVFGSAWHRTGGLSVCLHWLQYASFEVASYATQVVHRGLEYYGPGA